VGRLELGKKIESVRELNVYKAAFHAAMEIFQISKQFPVEEKYSLTDQIRRSSRSICSNLAEAWRKRRYKAVFVNKLSDAMQEASETQTWLDFCLACKYITQEIFEKLDKDGRIIAQSNNLPITGTLGILLKAKKTGLISSVKPLIDELRSEHNFWIRDDMYQKVLYIAREKT
jgi:four helix bundle protein